MAIDPLSEQLLSFADAAKFFPSRRAGKKVSISCLYRWATAGCRGVLLETVVAGAGRVTSREAIGRFIERLTYGEAKQPRMRSPHKRQKASDAAAKELARMGV